MGGHILIAIAFQPDFEHRVGEDNLTVLHINQFLVCEGILYYGYVRFCPEMPFTQHFGGGESAVKAACYGFEEVELVGSKVLYLFGKEGVVLAEGVVKTSAHLKRFGEGYTVNNGNQE